VKKLIALILVASFLAVSTVGCGGTPTSKPTTPAKTDK
jgi:archaellin